MASASDVDSACDHQRPMNVVEVIDAECLLIRNLLTLDEQTELFEYIQRHDKTLSNQPQAMVPAPKTLLLGDNGSPNRTYEYGQNSVVNVTVAKAGEILRNQNLSVLGGFDVCEYSSLSMATICYKAPDGKFPPHVDHCKDSLVFLTSLGCTANFMVKTPAMSEKTFFKLHSGDMLVFNASSEAAVLHAVVSIDETGSRDAKCLGSRFDVLQNHRYGVQCRMYFQTKVSSTNDGQ
eukprot:TRINITY_DN50801_c0_g1_i1.p1 TRINITY_DN50801_c0_g1~~TRINITY_DN50801_c0_g1_i1.p1  ORF type:complete len:235 (+),score=26.97 TRINITY_DN50801_c0_g1_i1:49-753(+)